ncbi:MAG: pyruvate dehydrogenase complex dihydrolipoamide acetyltransferase [Hyphomicrobiales bacterium]
MPIPILMPALSPTMETGRLAKWLVREGDAIASGDVIAEIETDKATMEVEAVDDGTIGKILVAEGSDDVAVNQPIAVMLEEGEGRAALEDFIGNRSKSAFADVAGQTEAATQPATQNAEVMAENGAHVALPSATANGGRERLFASPLARRLAKKNKIDLGRIAGSGPHGRIVKRDVEAAIDQAIAPVGSSAEPAVSPSAVMSDDEILKLYEQGSYDMEPHDSMRKIIAERLCVAKQTIPHFYLTVDCALDALLSLRARLNAGAPRDAEGKPAWKISVNDCIIKALGMALKRVPEANVAWTRQAMLKHRHCDVGVAVAIEGGLVTPVVRKVDTKGLLTISREMKDFVVRARERKLLPHDYRGATTSVSNLGMFGIREFSAIINPPQATILAVGAGEKRAVVGENGAVRVKTLMTATLSSDHRAVDGALGARFLSAFKSFIEDPAIMLL